MGEAPQTVSFASVLAAVERCEHARKMNNTTEGWWANYCIPWVAIEACPPDQIQAYIVWGRLFLGLDIAAILVLTAALLRRIYLVEESFNTIRLLLIKFLLAVPLYVL